MTGVELAAIITALGAFVAAVGSLIVNQRKIDELNTKLAAQLGEIDDLKVRERAARKRLRFLKRLLMQREQENNRLLAREKNWQTWGDAIGRMLNELQLEVGALQTQLKSHEQHNKDDTQPLTLR